MSDWTQTPNLHLYKPVFNSDVDQWGGHLNANSDTLDALIPQLATSLTGGAAYSLPAAAGAAQSQQLLAFLSPVPGLQVLQVRNLASGAGINYTLELFDGTPGSGTLLFQATHITLADYHDDAGWYAPPPASGTVWGRLTNIGASAMTSTLSLRAMAIR